MPKYVIITSTKDWVAYEGRIFDLPEDALEAFENDPDSNIEEGYLCELFLNSKLYWKLIAESVVGDVSNA